MSSDTEIFRRLRALEAEVRQLKALEFTARTGSFTPTLIAGGSGSFTVTAYGFWLRVGALCFVTGQITVTALSAPTGTVTIGSLPFTSRNQTNERALLLIGNYDLINLTASYTQLAGLILPFTDSAIVREAGDNVAAATVQAGAVASTAFLEFSGCYEVA